MKNWLANLITDCLAAIYAKLGRTLVVLGPRDSALVITEKGDVSSVLSVDRGPASNASRGWVIMLNWGFTPEAGDAYDELTERFHRHFSSPDDEALDMPEA